MSSLLSSTLKALEVKLALQEGPQISLNLRKNSLRVIITRAEMVVEKMR
jgi:hypothetical protein